MTKTTDKMEQAAQQIIALMKEHGTNWAKPWTGIGGVHNAAQKALSRLKYLLAFTISPRARL